MGQKKAVHSAQLSLHVKNTCPELGPTTQGGRGPLLSSSHHGTGNSCGLQLQLGRDARNWGGVGVVVVVV